MSNIRANTISDAAGTGPIALTKQSAAKAWGNYYNSGGFALRDSFNVSSITDTAAGRCTVNYSNNMSDGNYSTPASGGNDDATATFYGLNPQYQTVSATELRGRASSTGSTLGLVDLEFCFFAIHGDLA